MLDGRQIAVVARGTQANHAEAQRLLRETKVGEPWEAAVAAYLGALT